MTESAPAPGTLTPYIIVKNAEAAVASRDKAAALAALRAAEPEMMRAVKSGALKKNAAARKISRLAKSIKAL